MYSVFDSRTIYNRADRCYVPGGTLAEELDILDAGHQDNLEQRGLTSPAPMNMSCTLRFLVGHGMEDTIPCEAWHIQQPSLVSLTGISIQQFTIFKSVSPAG